MIRITLPQPGQYKKNTADIIITVLATDFPLTLKQLHNRVKYLFGISITYQAIRKAVHNLLKENVLIKQEKAYLINRTWILESRKFIEQLQKSYFELAKPKEKIKVGEQVTEYTFSNLIEKDKLWCKIQEDWLNTKEKNEPEIIAWNGMHNWWLLGQLEHETRFMNLIKGKVNVYQLINGHSYLDKHSVKFYHKLGINCTINNEKNIDKSSYIVVFGDYIMQTFYPKTIVDKLERFYNKTKTLEDVDLNEIMVILTEKAEIKVTLIKNKIIAEKMRNDILRHFES